MFKYAATLLVLVVSLASAGPGDFTAGFRFQKTYNLYYENGFELGYTHEKLWSKRIQFGLSYVSSRLGSAIGDNAIKQDYYQLPHGLTFADTCRQFAVDYYQPKQLDEFKANYQTATKNNLSLIEICVENDQTSKQLE